MKNLSTLIFILIINFIYSQYFSVESLVNSSHWKEDIKKMDELKIEVLNYTKTNLKNKLNSLQRQKQYHHQNISISIPYKIAEKTFLIKLGDIVTQIYKNNISGIDTIIGFESVMDGNGNIRNYFKLKNLQNRHDDWYDVRENEKQQDYYFYIIGSQNAEMNFHKNDDNFIIDNYIDAISRSIINEAKINKEVEYSILKRNNIISQDSIKSRLLTYCDFNVCRINIDNDDCSDLIIQIKSNNYTKTAYWHFCILLYSSLKNTFLIPFHSYEFSFILNNNTYFLCKGDKPATGARGRELYCYDKINNKIYGVFGDWSWSD